MAIEEILAQAMLSGGITMLNCSIIVGSNAQMSDFLQNTSASTQNPKQDQDMEVDPRLKSEKAVGLWKRLVDNKYIHAEGSWYVWDGTQAEYGYMVYIVSDLLGVKHPSNNNILWKSYHSLFLNAPTMESVAKVSVSKDISQINNYKLWCNGAKKLHVILCD